MGSDPRRWQKGHELHAPSLIGYELANVAWKKLRGARAHAEATFAALAVAGRLNLHLAEPDPVAVLARAVATALTPYDASYLWPARTLDLDLVTLDDRLRAPLSAGTRYASRVSAIGVRPHGNEARESAILSPGPLRARVPAPSPLRRPPVPQCRATVAGTSRTVAQEPGQTRKHAHGWPDVGGMAGSSTMRRAPTSDSSSHAARHHHVYDLAPTPEELQAWRKVVMEVVERTEPPRDG